MELASLRALPGNRERIGLIGKRLFPDSYYMMIKYDTHSRALLPYLYLKRPVLGINKVLREAKHRLLRTKNQYYLNTHCPALRNGFIASVHG